MGLIPSVVAAERFPVMPDFARERVGFAHTVESAMQVLDSMGIPDSRLTLRVAGPGRPSLQIVRQSPVAGTPLTPSVPVTLWIAGLGFFEALPLPMRESGGEAEMGTRELSAIFDDPLQKAAQWFRAGAPLFNIGPDKLLACRRWLALFGIESSMWPDELLYPLALLAPTLARMAGRPSGIQLAFLVLGLPVFKILHQHAHRFLEPQQQSLLGCKASRLGRDLVAGDRQLDTATVTIQLGPVSLDIYAAFQSDRGRRLIEMISDLCMSAYQAYSIAWMVEDACMAPRLGFASRNSRIGLNFHLGREART
jgi:hypothetical protein